MTSGPPAAVAAADHDPVGPGAGDPAGEGGVLVRVDAEVLRPGDPDAEPRGCAAERIGQLAPQVLVARVEQVDAREPQPLREQRQRDALDVGAADDPSVVARARGVVAVQRDRARGHDRRSTREARVGVRRADQRERAAGGAVEDRDLQLGAERGERADHGHDLLGAGERVGVRGAAPALVVAGLRRRLVARLVADHVPARAEAVVLEDPADRVREPARDVGVAALEREIGRDQHVGRRAAGLDGGAGRRRQRARPGPARDADPGRAGADGQRLRRFDPDPRSRRSCAHRRERARRPR